MPPPRVRFDVPAFLQYMDPAYCTTTHDQEAILFAQGDACAEVFYLQHGRVELSVSSPTGRVAVVAVLGPGDFFGEGGLTGQSVRRVRARAMTSCTILAVATTQMRALLQTQRPFAARFLAHLLARQFRAEAHLLDQMFHPAEQRLARVLWGLAQSEPSHTVPRMTQQTLADMIGTGRSRTNILLNRLKKRGLIDTVDERVIVNDALRRFISDGASLNALSPPVTRPGRETILLVDDDASVRTIVGQMLEHSGYRVLVAGVSEEACALFDDHAAEVDLLLADVVMPDMSGTALAQRLVSRQPRLAVLLMSGYETTATFPAARADRTGFLEKPFRIPALTSAVRRLLDTGADAA